MAVGDKKGGLGFTVTPSQQMGVGVISLEIINAAVHRKAESWDCLFVIV